MTQIPAQKLDALKELVGDDILATLLGTVETKEKAASAAGARFKAEGEEGTTADLVEDAATTAAALAGEDEAEEGDAEYVGDMAPAALSALIANAVMQAMAPMHAEMKAMSERYGQAAQQKDDERATADEQMARLQTRIKELADAEQARAKAAQQQLAALEAKVKELSAEQPRAAGYRASIADDTAHTPVVQALKERQQTEVAAEQARNPVFSFLDEVMGSGSIAGA